MRLNMACCWRGSLYRTSFISMPSCNQVIWMIDTIPYKLTIQWWNEA